jgi:hypothetical protein
MTEPSISLMHGGVHGAWCWDLLASELRAHEYFGTNDQELLTLAPEPAKHWFHHDCPVLSGPADLADVLVGAIGS